MDVTISTLGAVIGLTIAIVLIIKKINPAYSLILGSIIGGLVGGANLTQTISLMIKGSQSIIPAILRILTAGILAGVLIESGAAASISKAIIDKIGEKKAIIAIVLSTMILTMVGVFIDIAVITVSAIALSVAKKAKISKTAILIAMIGGGKAGNIMSPNPNAIAASDAFKVPLTSVMGAGIIPAIVGVIVTITICYLLKNKGAVILDQDILQDEKELPKFWASISGPLISIILLSLRPIAKINIDPLIALPVGGIIGAILMGKVKNLNNYCLIGLNKMTGVAILLLGTGTISGIIANSNIKDMFITSINSLGLSSFILAPIAGILMAAATASTTSGTAVAAGVFSPSLNTLGIAPLSSAAMIHSGATVLDSLPHGSFFHATGGSVNMNINDRLKLIPFEALIGFSMTVTSTLIFGVLI